MFCACSEIQAFDVAVLGNICIDIIVPVDSLPPSDKEERIGYMEQLFSRGIDESMWEVQDNARASAVHLFFFIYIYIYISICMLE